MPLKRKKPKTKAKKKVLKRKPAKLAKKKIVRKKTVKRVVKKKIAAKKPALKKRPAKKGQANLVGEVTHYFPKVRAAVLKAKLPLAKGDMIQVKGHTTDFKQKVTSMQIERVPIDLAKKGDEIGLLVDSRVRRGDKVTKI